MDPTNNQKISISLSPQLLKFAEEYRQTHGLPTRSEVMAAALKALQEKEWAEAYRHEAEVLRKNPDSWVDSGLDETLEMLDRG